MLLLHDRVNVAQLCCMMLHDSSIGWCLGIFLLFFFRPTRHELYRAPALCLSVSLSLSTLCYGLERSFPSIFTPNTSVWRLLTRNGRSSNNGWNP